MAYKCNSCGELFETATPSYRTVCDGQGNFENEYDCECCPECGSRNFNEVKNDEL